MSAPQFYILDARSCVGNCALWWRPDDNGYTCNLDEAGLYGDDFDGRPTDVLVPEAEARSLVRSHVSWDALSGHLKRARDEQERLAKLNRPKCDATTAKGEPCSLTRAHDGTYEGEHLCHIHVRQFRRLEDERRAEIRRFEDDDLLDRIGHSMFTFVPYRGDWD